MASHVIGPLLIAERPLNAEELDTLDVETIWSPDVLESIGYLFARLTEAPTLSARLEVTSHGE